MLSHRRTKDDLRQRAHPAGAALALALLGLAVQPAAQATLGEPLASVARDGARMKVQVRAPVEASAGTAAPGAASAGYTVHEMATAGGTVVREYAGPDQRVFAVTWRGPYMPNLKDLLGSHYDALQAATRAGGPRAQRRVSTVRTGDLVVERQGHMRAFTGRAYLNSMLPAGVALAAIR